MRAGAWSQRAYVKVSSPVGRLFKPKYGQSVALSTDTLAIGAPYERGDATGVGGSQANASVLNAGAAYVFH